MEVEVETGIIDYLLLLVFLVLVFLFFSLEIIARPLLLTSIALSSLSYIHKKMNNR